MQQPKLQDRIDRGLGAAARHIGAQYDAYRPAGPNNPLAPANRFLRLPAAFSEENRTFRRPIGYGRAAWAGLFDTAYTTPGDYLRGPGGTFFIASQQSLMPAICILANRTLSIARPAAPAAAGVNAYGGVLAATETPILTDWPASVLFAGAGAPGELPGDGNTPTWTILLPSTSIIILGADVITDDQGKTYVAGSTELTGLGWRILAKQSTN